MYCTPGASGRRSVLTMMAPQVLLQTTMWIHHHCKDLKYIFSSCNSLTFSLKAQCLAFLMSGPCCAHEWWSSCGFATLRSIPPILILGLPERGRRWRSSGWTRITGQGTNQPSRTSSVPLAQVVEECMWVIGNAAGFLDRGRRSPEETDLVIALSVRQGGDDQPLQSEA